MSRKFEFYSRFGHPGSTPEARAAFAALPILQRTLIYFNPLAFIFGPIYFAVVKAWRKGLSILGGGLLALAVVSFLETVLPLPNLVFVGVVIATMAVFATTANWAAFVAKEKRSESWNPFEGTPLA